MVTELRSQSPEFLANEEVPILVAGDPEKQAEKKRRLEGIPVDLDLEKKLNLIAQEQGLSLFVF
jgi:LDH2 family malate/lactate/ureidoglycolate dehydrogenase